MGVFVREYCLTLADKAGQKSEEKNSEIWGNINSLFSSYETSVFKEKHDYSNSFFSIPQSTKFAWIVLQKLDFETASKKKYVN